MLAYLLACGVSGTDTDPKDTAVAVDTDEPAETAETADTAVDSPADSPVDSPVDSCTTPYYVDNDGDHWGTDEAGAACELPEGMAWLVGDCDDTNNQIHPSTDELCNGVDDDCDGTIDVGAIDALPLFVDADGDGFGDVATTACLGAGLAEQDGDCDDVDPTVNPAGVETCDDGVDQDCSGSDARCSFGGTIDYTAADATFEGSSDIFLGYTLSTVGDTDGDGLDDLLIGASESTGSGGGGSTYPYGSFVWGGSVPGGTTKSSAMTLVNVDSVSGRILMDADLDDDGLTDIVSYGYADASYSGLLFHWGSAAHPGAWATLSTDNAVEGTLTDWGGSQGDVGDADGDGIDDIVFSRYLGVGVFYGEAGTRDDSWIADWPSIEGGGGYFGGGGVVLEDFDGDGLDDVAFADVYMDMTGSDYPGGAYMILSTGRMSGTLDVYTGYDAQVHGPSGSGNVMAGYELIGGDLDGDGYAELVMGSHMYGGLGADWIFRGGTLTGDLTTADADATLIAASAAGMSVGLDMVDDLDGDGGKELFVGASSGSAYVFAGGTLSGTFDESAAAVTLTGPVGSLFGSDLAHGDLDADGLIDLVVSGYYYNSGAGGVWFFSGTGF